MKEIPLTQGKVALVDDEDFDRVNQFKWHVIKSRCTYYAGRRVRPTGEKQTTVRMHCFIRGLKGVDHRNGDGLDNQKENLRPASKQQNARAKCGKIAGASSQFRGVSWYPSQEKWKAQFHSDGKSFWLGYFSEETEAAKAYDKAAREHFGEFAAPNFP